MVIKDPYLPKKFKLYIKTLDKYCIAYYEVLTFSKFYYTVYTTVEKWLPRTVSSLIDNDYIDKLSMQATKRVSTIDGCINSIRKELSPPIPWDYYIDLNYLVKTILLDIIDDTYYNTSISVLRYIELPYNIHYLNKPIKQEKQPNARRNTNRRDPNVSYLRWKETYL